MKFYKWVVLITVITWEIIYIGELLQLFALKVDVSTPEFVALGAVAILLMDSIDDDREGG